MKKISKTREFTKTVLLDAFWDLYKKHEIEKITIKKITDKAGYNRITFYEYFEDIYDVLDCIEEKILSEIENKVQLYTENTVGVHSDTFIENMASLCDEYNEYAARLFGKNGDKGFEEKLQNFLKIILMKSPITISNFNDKYVVEFYTSGLVGAIRTWYRNGCDIPVKTFINTIYTVL